MAAGAKRLSMAMFIAAVMSGMPVLNGPGHLEAATSASTVPVAPSVLATVMRSDGGLALLVLWRGSPGWWSRSAGHVSQLPLDPGGNNVEPMFESLGPLFRRSTEIVSFLRCDVGEMTPAISSMACGSLAE